jgi:predicted phosphodiesterase
MRRDIEGFDREHGHVLKRIWLLGDVHGQFEHIARVLDAASEAPRWLVFLGDVELTDRPLREVLAQLMQDNSSIQVLFVHGNHDADSHERWELMHDCGSAVEIHGRVFGIDGVRLAGTCGRRIT